MSFLDQEALYRAVPGLPVWVDVGGHDSLGWWSRKSAEVAHTQGCGPRCQPGCGPASELLGIAQVRAHCRGDLIVPAVNTTLTLKDVLSIVTFGIGASCGAIVVDDLGAILAQRPTASWWRTFAAAADASTDDGVKVLLLAAPKDVANWPDGLPKPAWVRSGADWWLGGEFGSEIGVLS